MQIYLDMVIILNFFVNFLLIMGTNRLCSSPARPTKAVFASALGGVYAGACLLPSFAFLAGAFWHLLCLGLMSGLAFGWTKNMLRRGCVFVLLNMALSGIVLLLRAHGFWTLLAAAGGIFLLCAVSFKGRIGGHSLVPVELSYGGKRICLTALQDTGNMLRDPISGREVLIVGADVARKLTGLTAEQLRKPVESMGAIPGLRLIPYKTIGQSGGLLLALRLPQVRIGSWHGSSLVAFAPEGLNSEGEYQALTGGML